MSEEKIEGFFQKNAKKFIDSMFEAGVFNDKMTRDDFNGYEDLLAFFIQSQCKSHYKMVEFSYKFKNK